MQQSSKNPELRQLNALVGEWNTEATHPMLPSVVVHGHSKVEWLEGEQFLIHRSRAHHSDFPDSISIIGAIADGMSMYYFDSRGVHRIYGASLQGDVFRLWREAPGFSQRFMGRFAADGNTIAGLWELSRDGSTWDDDLEITYRRVR